MRLVALQKDSSYTAGKQQRMDEGLHSGGRACFLSWLRRTNTKKSG